MRAAIYARVSTRHQEEKGIPQQIDACRAWCEKERYDVQEHLILSDTMSGTEFDGRKGLQQLLLAGERKEFDVVVVWRLDRFSRDRDDFHMVRLIAKKHGWQIESTLEGKSNLNDPMDDVMLDVLGAVHELDRQRIMQQFERGRNDRIKQGKLSTTTVPLFGYRYPVNASGKEIRDRYEIDEETARIVRRIFEMVARGMTSRKVAQQLNEDGEPTPAVFLSRRGHWSEKRPIAEGWRGTQIGRMISNPAYYGEAQANRYYAHEHNKPDPITKENKKSNAMRKRAADASELVPLPVETCPPIVSKPLALAAQEAARRNKAEAAKDGIAKETLLLRGGILRCGYCGSIMYGVLKHDRKKLKKRRYICSRHTTADEFTADICSGAWFTWDANELDGYVWQVVLWVLTDPTELTMRVHDWEENQANTDEPQEGERRLQDAIADLKKRLKNVRAQLERANDTEALGHWQTRERELKVSLLKQQNKLQDLQDRLAQKQDYKANVKSLVKLGQLAYDELQAVSIEEKREVLHWLGVWGEAWKKGTAPPVVLDEIKRTGYNLYLAEEASGSSVPGRPPDMPVLRPDVHVHIEFNGFGQLMPAVFVRVLRVYADSIPQIIVESPPMPRGPAPLFQAARA